MIRLLVNASKDESLNCKFACMQILDNNIHRANEGPLAPCGTRFGLNDVASCGFFTKMNNLKLPAWKSNHMLSNVWG